MTFDELQKTWQSHQENYKLKIDSNLVLKEAKRNQRHFESIIFWRDIRETSGVSLMVLLCGYFWLKYDFWQLLVLLPGVLFVAAFIIIDRIVQKRKQPKFSETLSDCIKSSLWEVNHQTWLLKNVLWWYLSPLFIGILIFLLYAAWTIRDIGALGYILCSGILVVCILVYIHIYYLNQKAIKKELDPRRYELEYLLNSLKNANV